MPEYLHDANVKPEKLIIILLLGAFSFSARAGLNDGLVAYYPFNGNANDASGNGNNGIVYGATVDSDRFGNPNASYRFSGSGEWIRANIGPSYFASDFAISAWVNFSDFNNEYPMIISGDTYFVHCHGLGPVYGNNYQHIVYYGGSVGGIYSSNAFVVNRWYHICITRQGADTKMNVNGIVVGEDIHTPVASATGSYLQIGNDFNFGSSDFHGEIDDLRIYNRALSDSEVQQLYSLPYIGPLTVVQTNRTPTTAEITPLLAALPTPSQLMAFHGGIFTTNLASIDPNQMTVVLTHGWRDDPYSWATSMANLIHNNLPSPSPNIMAWDWSLTAKSAPDDPGIPAAQTGDQGRALGEKLLLTLGANYSKPIHFVGHSLGTLVNASAANYLQGTNWANEDESPTPWLATNMQMTLFDEAEVATGQNGLLNGIRTLIGWNGNPFAPKPSYYHPLPKQFAWADNYVSAFGLLHPEAANVILTNGSPTDAPNPLGLYNELQAFHGYPMNWYDETIQTDVSAMGFLWSFERGGWFSQAPAKSSVYVQANSEWNLSTTNWNYGTNYLNARFQKYQILLADSFAQFTVGFVNGSASGQAIDAGEWS